MFADDTTLFQSSKGTQCLLLSEMKPVCDWFPSNKFTVNPNKCEAMCFGRGKPETIRRGSAELDHKTSCKYSGIHLEKKLNLHEHIKYVVKKMNKFCGLNHKICPFYPWKCLLMFHNSFAKSINCYVLLVYGSAAKNKFAKKWNSAKENYQNNFFQEKIRDTGGCSSRSLNPKCFWTFDNGKNPETF